MPWAIAADVLTYCGVELPPTPDPTMIMALANSTIDIYCNRSPAASASMSPRDLLSLKKAACFQAAWLLTQPDYLGRSNVRSTTVDGESVAFHSQSEQNLAPMAERALRNLSWKGSRTLSTPDIGVPPGGGSIIDFTSEASDTTDDWQPY